MKFTISYKFKLKMAQNLSGRSGPVGADKGRSGPIRAVRCRCRGQTARNAVLVRSKLIFWSLVLLPDNLVEKKKFGYSRPLVFLLKKTLFDYKSTLI